MPEYASHLPSAQGDGDPHLHATAYEREFDSLVAQLVRTASVRYLGHDGSTPMPSVLCRFRLIAGLAVALVDSGTITRLKAQTVAECSDDRQVVTAVQPFAMEVLDVFLNKAMTAGQGGR